MHQQWDKICSYRLLSCLRDALAPHRATELNESTKILKTLLEGQPGATPEEKGRAWANEFDTKDGSGQIECLNINGDIADPDDICGNGCDIATQLERGLPIVKYQWADFIIEKIDDITPLPPPPSSAQYNSFMARPGHEISETSLGRLQEALQMLELVNIGTVFGLSPSKAMTLVSALLTFANIEMEPSTDLGNWHAWVQIAVHARDSAMRGVKRSVPVSSDADDDDDDADLLPLLLRKKQREHPK